jgi:hypothetical protein
MEPETTTATPAAPETEAPAEPPKPILHAWTHRRDYMNRPFAPAEWVCLKSNRA